MNFVWKSFLVRIKSNYKEVRADFSSINEIALCFNMKILKCLEIFENAKVPYTNLKTKYNPSVLSSCKLIIWRQADNFLISQTVHPVNLFCKPEFK